MASRVIADVLEKKMVKRYDPENLSKKAYQIYPFLGMNLM